MTENTEAEAPPNVDLLDLLTLAEIDAGSRELGTSLVAQLSTKGERWEQALAVVAWLHKRRTDRSTDPKQLLRQLRELRWTELQAELQRLADSYAPDGGDDDPLARGPE